MDDVSTETIHDLLLDLAGRVDDDLLAWARELVAVGETQHAFEVVGATLVADQTELPPAARAALVEVTRSVRTELDVDGALAPSRAADGGTPHRFDPRPAPDVLAAVRGLPSRLLGGCRVLLTHRLTPAGSAPGPLPHPVVLVEVSAGARNRDVLAYQLADALDRAGVRASVEVMVAGAQPPAYHVAALREAQPVPPAGPGGPGRPGTSEPPATDQRSEPGQPPSPGTSAAETAPWPVPLRAGSSQAESDGLGSEGSSQDGPDTAGSDHAWSGRPDSDQAGSPGLESDLAGSDRLGSNRAGSSGSGLDRPGSDGAGAARVESSQAEPDHPGAEHSGPGQAGPNRADADEARSDPAWPERVRSDHDASDQSQSGRAQSDHSGPDEAASDQAGVVRAGSDLPGSDHIGADRAWSEHVGSNGPEPDDAGPDRTGSERSTGRARSERVGSERGGPDWAGSDWAEAERAASEWAGIEPIDARTTADGPQSDHESRSGRAESGGPPTEGSAFLVPGSDEEPESHSSGTGPDQPRSDRPEFGGPGVREPGFGGPGFEGPRLGAPDGPGLDAAPFEPIGSGPTETPPAGRPFPAITREPAAELRPGPRPIPADRGPRPAAGRVPPHRDLASAVRLVPPGEADAADPRAEEHRSDPAPPQPPLAELPQRRRREPGNGTGPLERVGEPEATGERRHRYLIERDPPSAAGPLPVRGESGNTEPLPIRSAPGRPAAGPADRSGPIRPAAAADPSTPSAPGSPAAAAGQAELGLRPESVARLSASGRELLARLQAELQGGPQLGQRPGGQKSTVDSTGPQSRVDPPDLAG